METDKESFKKMFPHLSRELEFEGSTVASNSLPTETKISDKVSTEIFRHYNPTVLDFMRRCETEKEAETIIAYLETRGELTKEYAEKLRQQLMKNGLRSFGSKKEENYYFKQGGLC